MHVDCVDEHNNGLLFVMMDFGGATFDLIDQVCHLRPDLDQFWYSVTHFSRRSLMPAIFPSYVWQDLKKVQKALISIQCSSSKPDCFNSVVYELRRRIVNRRRNIRGYWLGLCLSGLAVGCVLLS
jgi:hypothetical protein